MRDTFKFNPKGIWNFIKEVFGKFIVDKGPKLGASLSFYTIFSLAPLMIIAISLAGFIFGEEAARGQLFYQIRDLIGDDGAQVLQTALKNTQYSWEGIVTVIISLVTMLIGSTVVFVELQESLDMIWKVKPKPGYNIIKGIIKDRLKSFAVVVATGFLLLVSLLVNALISGLNNFVSEQFFTIPIGTLNLANNFLSFIVIFILFMMIFKFLPDVNIEWRHVWVGALVTALFFVIGKYLIGIYLGNSSLSSTYGAFGSLVVFLLWVYYSAQILFLGAEFTQVYANKYGEGIMPKRHFMKYHNESAVAESVDKK